MTRKITKANDIQKRLGNARYFDSRVLKGIQSGGPSTRNQEIEDERQSTHAADLYRKLSPDTTILDQYGRPDFPILYDNQSVVRFHIPPRFRKTKERRTTENEYAFFIRDPHPFFVPKDYFSLSKYIERGLE